MKQIIIITGMHCSSCSKLIEMELADKVKNISVNHETGKAIIDFDEKIISKNDIINKIKEMGYGVK